MTANALKYLAEMVLHNIMDIFILISCLTQLGLCVA